MQPYNATESDNFYKSYDTNEMIPVFSGSKYQKGHGIGNLFSGLIKAAIPLVKKGAISLGKTALQTGLNIAKDSIAGKELKSSLNDNLKLAGANILNSSANYLSRPKNNKKRKHTQSKVSSKSKVKKKRPRLSATDIFFK